MGKKKVVIFGCQQIAVEFIDFLSARKDIEVPLVVTYELPMDKTYGYKSVLEEAAAKKINVKKPKMITAALIDEVERIDPDIIFSIYYRKIFPKKLIDIPPLGCVNIHPGLLPKYRGPVPTAWAIMNGEKVFGITLHYMDERVDTGDILVQKKYRIGNNETGYELYTRAMKLGAKLLKENFDRILNKKIHPYRQRGPGSYYGKKGWRYIIDWQQKAEDIRNMIRVHARPYNSAESPLFNRYVLIDKATPVKNLKYILQGPGRIVDVLSGKRLVVSCADGFLRLDKYEIFPRLTRDEQDIYLKAGNTFD